MAISIRPITADETDEFWIKLHRGFGKDRAKEEASTPLELLEALMGLDRTIAAFGEGEIVGTGGTFGFDLAVPGAVTPMGGLTMVTVQPTHTRRGLLRGMIEAHLDDVRARGEFVSGLWASESSIYGRFGYGVAAHYLDISFEAAAAGLGRSEHGHRVVLLEPEAAADVLPDLYAVLAPQRPGLLSRSQAWWKHEHFDDPEHRRQGSSKPRYAVAYRAEEPVGYAMYRQKPAWEDSLPRGEVHVAEVIGIDDAANRSLWAYLGSIDLFPLVTCARLPLDFDLQYHVSDPRRIKRVLTDGLYLQIVDVIGALEARRYRVDGSIVIRLHDEDVAACYRLLAVEGVATCSRTDDEPDVTMEVGTLSSLYLGGMSAVPLGRVGLIEGSDEATRRLDVMMSWDVAPWCAEVF